MVIVVKSGRTKLNRYRAIVRFVDRYFLFRSQLGIVFRNFTVAITILISAQ